MINLREISKMTWAIIGGVVVLGSVVGGVIGSLTYLRTEFAPIALADDVRLNGIRLEQKIIHDNIDFTVRQMRQIQIRCRTNDPLKMETDAQQFYYKLQMDLDKYNRQLLQLNQKGGRQ